MKHLGTCKRVRIEPTNNAAERELRALVLHRRVTQGTRGEAGRRWWERSWSVRATLGKQQKSFFGFVRETLRAARGGAHATNAGVRAVSGYKRAKPAAGGAGAVSLRAAYAPRAGHGPVSSLSP